MKKKYKRYILLFSMLLIIAVYFSNKVTFYKFNTSLGKVKMVIQQNTKSVVNGQLLWFTYDKDNIFLNTNALIDSPNIKLFALTQKGNKKLNNKASIKLSDEFTGTFVAIAPELNYDVNGDGQKDLIYAVAKTDTQATQGFAPVNTKFSNENLPFEVVLSNKSNITLFYKNQPLANKEVIVNSSFAQNKSMSTDKNGQLGQMDIREVRKGLNIQYKDDDGIYYNFSYQVENNSLFDSRHFESMMPIFKVLLYSAFLILIILILRNRGIVKTRIKNTKSGKIKELILHIKFLISRIFKLIKSINITFSMVRWFCMLASFVILVYGVQFFGKKITLFEIPTFACPQNADQFIGSSCYYLCHLNSLFQGDMKTILMFFATNLAIIILLGRTLCGFVCPFGLMQDLIYNIRGLFRINSIPLNEKIYRIINKIKWLLVLIFFGCCSLGLNFCEFCPAIVTSPAFAGFKLSLVMCGFMAVLVFVASFFKRRFWCNICPLGYAIGLFNKISLFRIRKNCQSCTECGACYEACPMGIKSIYTERKKENITTCDCIMCGECVKKCPENDAIAMAVLKKKFYVASRFKFFQQKKKFKSIKMPFFNKEL